MSNSFENPADFVVVGQDGYLTPVWRQWITRIHNAVASMYQAGTTADRPIGLLWIGRRYFDSSLGKPVYVKSVRPTVWVDGVGTVS